MTAQNLKLAPLSPLYEFSPPSLQNRPKGCDSPSLGNPVLKPFKLVKKQPKSACIRSTNLKLNLNTTFLAKKGALKRKITV